MNNQQPQEMTMGEAPTTAIATTTTTAVAAPTAQRGLLRPIASPKVMLEVMSETRAMLRDTLEEGTDYGVIPGTSGDKDKPARKVLLKPGAEKICVGFGVRAAYEVVEREVDHTLVQRFPSSWVEAPDPGFEAKKEMKEQGLGRNKKVNGEWMWMVPGVGIEETVGLYRYVTCCRLLLADGTCVGEGTGVCSSLESKYRGRPHEIENTVLKMSAKRAHVAAVLGTFALSDAFTQDMEDEIEKSVASAKPVASSRPSSDERVVDVKPKPAKKDSGATKSQMETIKVQLAALGITEERGAYLDAIVPGASTSAQWAEVIAELAARVESKSRPTADGGAESTVVPTSTSTATASTNTTPTQPAINEQPRSMITDEQRVRLLNMLEKGGAKTSAAKVGVVNGMLGRVVESLGELSAVEAHSCIALLRGPA